jgi:hypothetical protein
MKKSHKWFGFLLEQPMIKILKKKLKIDNNTLYMFDKGYNDYKSFKLFMTMKQGL